MSREDDFHVPVMAAEVLEALRPASPGTYVDCTLGDGGHAEMIARMCAPAGTVIGIDRDPEALAVASDRLKGFGERVRVVRASFADLEEVLSSQEISKIDGALFDLGVSSRQLLRSERGFSYNLQGPLDMRMDQDSHLEARDIVNTWDEDSLARLFFDYGEEKWAKRIASFICESRKRRPLLTTLDLVDVVKDAVPASARRKGGHPARRVFQALRIAVNDEMHELPKGLCAAVAALEEGGRVSVISYHSLEDRIVKTAFRQMAQRGVLRNLTPKPVRPKAAEVEGNPRSRSARLRAAEKL